MNRIIDNCGAKHETKITIDELLDIVNIRSLAKAFIKEHMGNAVTSLPAWENSEGSIVVDAKVSLEETKIKIAQRLTEQAL
jgi:thioredoxin-related protein